MDIDEPPASDRWTPSADAPCPLCLGPLSHDGHQDFSCEVGHRFSRHDLHASATGRSSIALWSATSALDAEAQVLRALAASSGRTELWDRAAAVEVMAVELRSVTHRYEVTDTAP